MPPIYSRAVFISYAHADNESPNHRERWLDRLLEFLKPLDRQGDIHICSDQQVRISEDWQTRIQAQIAEAKAVILLVSPAFLASDYIANSELPVILKNAAERGVKIFPVLISPTPFKLVKYKFPDPKTGHQEFTLSSLQAANLPDKTLIEMNEGEQNRVLERLADQLSELLSANPKDGSSDHSGATLVSLLQSAPISNLPDRNPFFTGREEVLAKIYDALFQEGRAALIGLGGVGKTETALEYAYRHLAEYGYILWVTADSRDAIASGYAVIAGLLMLQGSNAQDQTLAVKAVKNWLISHQDWLLILDNADELSMVRAFLPSGKKGHVLLTTQAQAVGAIARRVEIQEMGIEEGALLLLRRAGALDRATEADRASGRAIHLQLGGLPLALDQAGAYIEETGCGLSGYLDRYQNYASELLRHRGVLAFDYPDSVATTWDLSFQKVEQANPAAGELLKVCAFLYPDGIPEELFSIGGSELGSALEGLASDSYSFDCAVGGLLKYSLIYRDPNAGTLEIHRLVQFALKQGMDEAAQRLWAERVVRAVYHAFPKVEFSTWSLCERLINQAHICAELINKFDLVFAGAAHLLNQTGFYLYKRGRYIEVEYLLRQALKIYEALADPTPDFANTLNNLARFYRAKSRYIEAEPLFQRALAMREHILGLQHPDVARSLYDLARLYRDQERYGEAEAAAKRALEIRERELGPNHSDVAASLNDLARLYRAQGRYGEAESPAKRALEIREWTLDSDHPDVGASLTNLAGLYRAQGRYDEAEPLLKRALNIRKGVLGPDHPEVAKSLYGLARLYRAQGRYEEAEAPAKLALEIRERVLESDHPDVAKSLYGLARLYCDEGRASEAEPLYQRALAIWEKILGPQHRDVAACLENYAALLRKMDRTNEGAAFEFRARAIRAKIASPKSP
jgi:tetratricopeptide (TPR) repeat protein